MTTDELAIPIAERLLSLSQVYRLEIECIYQREATYVKIPGFYVSVVGKSFVRGGGLVIGHGYHVDHQASAMAEALDRAYRAAVKAVERTR